MKLDTVLFDLDGTLLDTLGDIADSLNYVLKKYSYPQRTIDEVQSFVGNGLGKLLERALPNASDAPNFSDMVVELKEYYAAHYDVKTKPYSGVCELLKKLKAVGIKTAIITNKPNISANSLHEKFFKDLTSFTIGETDGIAKKPAPDSVYLAMERLKSTKSCCIYVGDSEVDKATADNSGLPCILVSWGFRGRPFIDELTPFAVADKPEDILNILKISDANCHDSIK